MSKKSCPCKYKHGQMENGQAFLDIHVNDQDGDPGKKFTNQ